MTDPSNNDNEKRAAGSPAGVSSREYATAQYETFVPEVPNVVIDRRITAQFAAIDAEAAQGPNTDALAHLAGFESVKFIKVATYETVFVRTRTESSAVIAGQTLSALCEIGAQRGFNRLSLTIGETLVLAQIHHKSGLLCVLALDRDLSNYALAKVSLERLCST